MFSNCSSSLSVLFSSPALADLYLCLFFFLNCRPAIVAESVSVTLNCLNCESVCFYMLTAAGFQLYTWTTYVLHLLHFFSFISYKSL